MNLKRLNVRRVCLSCFVVLAITNVTFASSSGNPQTQKGSTNKKVVRFEDLVVPFCFLSEAGGNWCTDTEMPFVPQLHFLGVGVEPVISPDGKWIASVFDQPKHYIMLLNLEDYTKRVLTYVLKAWRDPVDHDPAFSADGRTVAFTSMRDAQIFEIFLINIDGSGLRQLTTTKEGENRYPVFSPDGHTIAFISNRHRGWFSRKLNLYLMDSDGGNQHLLRTPQPCDAERPTWSPDGKYIAFTSCTVNIVEVETARTRTLRSVCSWPTWTPDPNLILCEHGARNLFILNVQEDTLAPLMLDAKRQLTGSQMFAFKPSILKHRHTLELQQRPAKQVLIPVVVTDPAGAPVSGLQTTNFLVQAKDSTFDGSEEVLPATGLPNMEHPPLFVFFDLISVPPSLQSDVEHALLNLLVQAAQSNDPVSLVVNTRSGLQVVHDLTTDNRVFAEAVSRLSSAKRTASALQPSHKTADPAFESKVSAELARLQVLTGLMTDSGSPPQMEIAFKQLDGLEHFAAMLQQSSKRKLVVWIGAHFSAQVSDGELDFGSQTADVVPQLKALSVSYEHAVEALNLAHVSLFPLLLEGPPTSDPVLSPGRTRNALEQLARLTGGALLASRGDVAEAVAEARKSTGPYYVLHLGVKPAAKNPTWTSLKVEVDKPDLKVRSAPGFFALPFENAERR